LTGLSPGQGDDIATLKYDTAGHELWVVRYDGSGGSYDWPLAVTTDINGNTFVTGLSSGKNPAYDFATVKYDPSGIVQWAARSNRSTSHNAFPVSIATDQSGNVYIIGASDEAENSRYFVLIKYDKAGVEQWVNRYTAEGLGYPGGAQVDALGNIHVTVRLWQPSNALVTLKYSTTGNQLWLAQEKGNFDPSIMKVDADGNVYISGYGTLDSGEVECLIIKYDRQGARQWVKSLSTYSPTGLAVDKLGNVILTVSSYEMRSYNFKIAKFSPTGEKKWLTEHSISMDTTSIRVGFVTTDEDGNVFVGARAYKQGEENTLILVKYDQEGKQAWETTHREHGIGEPTLISMKGEEILVTCPTNR